MPFKEIKITEHSQNYHLVDFANDKYKELTEIIHQTEDSGIRFSSILLWIEANKEQIIQNCDTCQFDYQFILETWKKCKERTEPKIWNEIYTRLLLFKAPK